METVRDGGVDEPSCGAGAVAVAVIVAVTVPTPEVLSLEMALLGMTGPVMARLGMALLGMAVLGIAVPGIAVPDSGWVAAE